jgi:hypothetical protein
MSVSFNFHKNLAVISEFNANSQKLAPKTYLKINCPDTLEICTSKEEAASFYQVLELVEKLAQEIYRFKPQDPELCLPIKNFIWSFPEHLDKDFQFKEEKNESIKIKRPIFLVRSEILKLLDSNPDQQIVNLSDDELDRIISYLANEEKSRLRLVSKQFLSIVDRQKSVLKPSRLPTLTELKALFRWPHLKKVDFTSLEVLDDHLKTLSQFASIKEVVLTGCLGITGIAISDISKMTCLSKLQLSRCQNIINADFIFLKSIFTLEELELEKINDLSDEALRAISQITSLKKLDLTSCLNITDDGISYLESLSKLTHLKVANCSKITDKGFLSVARLSNLEFLNASMLSKITDKGFFALKMLKGLTYLDIAGAIRLSLVEPGFSWAFKNLKELDLSCCITIDDTGLIALSNNLDLHILRLFGCRLIGNEGVYQLNKQRNLKVLNIIECSRVSKEAINGLKTSLKDLKVLSSFRA